MFILVEARLNYVLKLLLTKCFIVQKLSGWFYQTDGKRCALCLTCGNKPLEIRTNDFTRIGTFEIILSHCCLFIWLCLRQDSKQFNKLWVTNFKKLCMTKKKVIFAAPLIYLNYTVDKHIIANLDRILFNLFVLAVNLNFYCSSEAIEVRANRLYRVCLTSVNYGHCSFRPGWSRGSFDR